MLSDQPITMAPIVIFPIAGGVTVNGTLFMKIDENLMRERDLRLAAGFDQYLWLTIRSTTTWNEHLGATTPWAAR